MSHVRVYNNFLRDNDVLTITDAETIHKVKDVLRLGAEKSLYLFDGNGKEFLCRIIDIKHDSIVAQKIKIAREEPANTPSLILGFPLVKEEKVDFILQKATELGVSEFVPFTCTRSIQSLPSESKVKRWQKILIEATRQSERLWIPKLNAIGEFTELIRRPYETKLAATITGENARDTLAASSKEIFIIVGPEGDFSHPEYAHLKENNFKTINLSPHILRVETAAAFAVGLVNYFLLHTRNP